mmetsp:Transcript_110317/g.311909  ORF Transcript_110317/g.311909 Transcript_110317/m.311909 type:complete len:517 (-) Transcript_110317:177-1727(-)
MGACKSTPQDGAAPGESIIALDGACRATDPSMSASAMKLLLVRPAVPAPLDPNFAPLVLGKRRYLAVVYKSTGGILEWALPRADGCARGSLPVFPEGHPDLDASIHLAGVLIQEMFWQRSASALLLSGPPQVCEALKKAYSPEGKFAFEVKTMPRVCGTPGKTFEVTIVSKASELPPAEDTPVVCGQDAGGCRLAFDLGKSDIKTVAVKDNEVLESKETEWDVTNPDPTYHWNKILTAMKETAAKLPKVDAIGGSATGTISADNEATWCDIFPNVAPDVYSQKVVPIFKNLAKEFGNVPLKVINDGEVTAIAGAMMVKEGNLMGISMGSSEGAGYCNADKNLLGWINELCYIQLDLNPEAPTDPWTMGHRGISHMYLGQRGATKLAAKAGIDVPPEMFPEHPNMNSMRHEPHAKCLKLIQAAMKDPAKEAAARQLYETVGVYLGYALAQYSEHYKMDNVIILGRVSSGEGGKVMCDTAKAVLAAEFPELSHIKFHFPDEHFKRVGQCIAAAALPQV